MLQTKELKILACYDPRDENDQDFVVFEQSTPVWEILSRQQKYKVQGYVKISFVAVEPLSPNALIIKTDSTLVRGASNETK